MSSNLVWVGYVTIVRKEITRILRIWGQTIVPPAITMTLYFIIFGELIGRRIGEMGGFTYMQYIVPGLVIMSVITNSYGNMVSSFFGAKFGKHIEELLISPLPNWVILCGYVTGALARGLMVGSRGHGGFAVLYTDRSAAPADHVHRFAADRGGFRAGRYGQRHIRSEI